VAVALLRVDTATPGEGQAADGPPWAPRPGDKRPHAVVIGAGFGGLAAAIRLGARGYRVTVLERLEQPAGAPACSGRTASSSTPGRPSSPRRSCSRSSGRCAAGALPTTSISARSRRSTACRFDDGTTSTCSGDRRRCGGRMARLSPGDVAGYERFLKASGELYRSASSSSATCRSARSPTWLASLPAMARLRA
jgi:phytoene desaturase